MAITTAICNSFLLDLAFARHNFALSGGNTFKLALIKPSMAGTYGAATTSYDQLVSNGDEVTGTGYVAGGASLTRVDPIISGGVVILDFADASWPTAVAIQVRGALLYNDSLAGNNAVRVNDFGQTLVADPVLGFSVQFPAATAAAAIVRWAAAA